MQKRLILVPSRLILDAKEAYPGAVKAHIRSRMAYPGAIEGHRQQERRTRRERDVQGDKEMRRQAERHAYRQREVLIDKEKYT